MEYVLDPTGSNVLPHFVEGTSGTKLLPRPQRLLAAVQVTKPFHLRIPGIFGPQKPVGECQLTAGSWIVVAQPGYLYPMPAQNVQSLGESNEAAPLRVERKAAFEEETRTSVAALRLFCDSHDLPGVDIFGVRRVKPAYVYGEVSQSAFPGPLRLPYGGYAIDTERWVDRRLLIIGEKAATFSAKAPRVVPHLFLAREYEAWEKADGTQESFGSVPS